MRRYRSWVALLLAAMPAVAASGENGPAELPTHTETVVVTGSRVEETLVESPVTLAVIGEERIRSTPADNFGDLLRGVPGLNVIQLTARDFNLTSRGATGTVANSQLVLLDGRSVYHDYAGFVTWDFLPVRVDELKQVEVLSGPGSAMWGPSALSGVVHLRTLSPRERPGGVLRFGGGEVGSFGGGLRWAQALERWSYKVSANLDRQDAWGRAAQLPSGLPIPPELDFHNEGTDQERLDVRADHEAATGRLLTFAGGIASSGGVNHSPLGPAAILPGDYFTYARARFSRGTLDANLHTDRFHLENLGLFNNLLNVARTASLSGDVTDRKLWGTHQTLVYGASFRVNRFDVSIAPDDDGRLEGGLFLEDQVHAGRFHLNLGGRLDGFDTIGATFSPRAGARFQVHRDHALRVAYGKAYRPPTLLENSLDVVLPTAVPLGPGLPPFEFTLNARGNEQLKEERADSFELAWLARVAGRGIVSLTGYVNRRRDLINAYTAELYSPSDPPPGWPLPVELVPPLPKTFGFRNVGRVLNRGAEVSADLRLTGRLATTATYTWQDRPRLSDLDAGIALNRPPGSQWSLALRGDSGRFTGSVSVSHVGSAFWSDVLDPRFWGTTGAYTLLDALVRMRLERGRFDVTVRGTNLTNRRVQQHAFGDVIRRRVTAEMRFFFGAGAAPEVGSGSDARPADGRGAREHRGGPEPAEPPDGSPRYPYQ